MKPHKHAELIKAWADGAIIEWVYATKGDGEKLWVVIDNPAWNESHEYRIKPEPKPDWNEYLVFFREDGHLIIRTYKTQVHKLTNPEIFGQLKVTIDGETGELKSAEVLK